MESIDIGINVVTPGGSPRSLALPISINYLDTDVPPTDISFYSQVNGFSSQLLDANSFAQDSPTSPTSQSLVHNDDYSSYASELHSIFSTSDIATSSYGDEQQQLYNSSNTLISVSNSFDGIRLSDDLPSTGGDDLNSEFLQSDVGHYLPLSPLLIPQDSGYPVITYETNIIGLDSRDTSFWPDVPLNSPNEAQNFPSYYPSVFQGPELAQSYDTPSLKSFCKHPHITIQPFDINSASPDTDTPSSSSYSPSNLSTGSATSLVSPTRNDIGCTRRRGLSVGSSVDDRRDNARRGFFRLSSNSPARAKPYSLPAPNPDSSSGLLTVPTREFFRSRSVSQMGCQRDKGTPHNTIDLVQYESSDCESSQNLGHDIPYRKVASVAGIKASEARRKKEAHFRCDMCNATFTTNHNKKNHLNSHLGVKNYRCNLCSKAFTTQSVQARHRKSCKKTSRPAS